MRLIDADAAIDAVEFECGEWRGLARTIVKAIKQLPSEQPDIVRCTNCRYNDGTAYCELHFRDVEGNDFCSWGEAKE